MNEPLKYDVRTRNMINTFPALAADLKLTYDETFLRYHNHVCPNCKEPMKVRDGEVKSVGTVSLFTLIDLGYAIPYVLCKTCKKQVENLPRFIWEREAVKIEDYILEKVPQFGEKKEDSE